MKPSFVSILILLLGNASALAGDAVPRRITSRLHDLGEVRQLHLAPGLASVIQLPFPITEVKIGRPDEVHAQISKTLPSELTLVLKRGDAAATNLIIRCGVRTFVFDILPSRHTHQDLVRISGAFGGPNPDHAEARLLDSSAPRTVPKDGRVLIDSSGGAR